MLSTDIHANPSYNPTVIGVGGFVSSWLAMVVFLFIFFGDKSYREKFKLDQSIFLPSPGPSSSGAPSSVGPSSGAPGDPSEPTVPMGLCSKLKFCLGFENTAADGKDMMVQDLCSAVVSSTTTQVLGRWGLGIQYKVSSLADTSTGTFSMHMPPRLAAAAVWLLVCLPFLLIPQMTTNSTPLHKCPPSPSRCIIQMDL